MARKIKNALLCSGGSKAVVDLRGDQGRAPPWGPNSFIFMQFSAPGDQALGVFSAKQIAKQWVDVSNYWINAPAWEILDPPLF